MQRCAEGADIEISQMSTTTTEVTVKKAGKGVEITDEGSYFWLW